jgi:hypothetical protein
MKANLSPAEAVAHLERQHGILRKTSTLAKWRGTGSGPRFMLAGRQILYRQDWLDEWALSILSEPKRSGCEGASGPITGASVRSAP